LENAAINVQGSLSLIIKDRIRKSQRSTYRQHGRPFRGSSNLASDVVDFVLNRKAEPTPKIQTKTNDPNKN